MKLSPGHLVAYARGVLLAGLLVGVLLLLGPFGGAARLIGLSDPAAHGIAFYLLTLSLFVAVPRTRRTDLALVALVLAVASEFAQALTGRDPNLSDFLFDLVGIFAAIAPALAERLRRRWRAHPSPG